MSKLDPQSATFLADAKAEGWEPSAIHLALRPEAELCPCGEAIALVVDKSKEPRITLDGKATYLNENGKKVPCVKDIWYSLRPADHGLCFNCLKQHRSAELALACTRNHLKDCLGERVAMTAISLRKEPR